MKPKEVILVGAGGHALSLAEFASERILGYIACEPNPMINFEWLGTDDDVSANLDQEKGFHVAYVYSGWPKMDSRRQLIEKYDKWECRFISLVAPSAIVTPNSEIGDGCSVMAGAIINRAKLGRHVIVNSGAIVEHDCVLGDNTFIGPGAVIGGFTSIGRDCFIGLGAKVGNGLKICDGVSVAMGCVVTRNLTEPGIYHGSPLRRLKKNL